MRFYLSLFFLYSMISFGQNRWINTYHENEDVYFEEISECYDNGYLFSGRYGPNYPRYSWLIKTNINGEKLWEKTIGDGVNVIVLQDISQDDNGSIYLCGGTSSYDPYEDPLIIKLNSCGEKEWCRIFHTDNNLDYAECSTVTPDGNIVVVLFHTNPESWVDRTCMAKLSSEGELVWKQCYTTSDTSQRNEVPLNIILTPDQGFLITGYCDYEDPTYPNRWWLHPYYLKVDSAGNFQWETVIYKETERDGGMGWTTVLSPNHQFYYSSISHNHHDTVFRCPALAKIDLQGNVVAIYDVAHGYKYGKMVDAQFLNDSILAASAGWGDSDDSSLWSKALLIDTLGNLLNYKVLVQSNYTSELAVTFDGKLLYASNTLQNDEFDVYLTKLNQNLEDDTIYTRPFTYDSLCPYQIVSDTIVQDDCGLIVGIEEQGSREAGKQGGMEIWPNPASGVIHVRMNMDARPTEGLQSFGRDGRFNKGLTLVIYDIFGREAPIPGLSPTGGKGDNVSWMVDVSALPPGVYIAILKNGLEMLQSRKFVVAH